MGGAAEYRAEIDATKAFKTWFTGLDQIFEG